MRSVDRARHRRSSSRVALNYIAQQNVFWPSVGGNKKFAHNPGTWPNGEKPLFKFHQPGVVPLLCW